MAKRDPVSEYLAEIGRKGGQVTGVPKGFGSLTPEERSANAKRANAARWGTKKPAKKKAGK